MIFGIRVKLNLQEEQGLSGLSWCKALFKVLLVLVYMMNGHHKGRTWLLAWLLGCMVHIRSRSQLLNSWCFGMQ